MARITIYRNGESSLIAGFSKDYEKSKRDTGVYSIIELMLKLLESKPDLQNKIILQQNFILSKDDKDVITKNMEEHIEKDIRNFKEAEDIEIYKNIVYKTKIYKAPFMRSYISLERRLLSAISLYNLFNDPDNSHIIEFKFG